MDFNDPLSEQYLERLDHLSLNDLADYFEQQADKCRKEAAKSARSDLERQAAGINYLIKSPRIVMRYLRTGCTLEEAIQETATYMGVPIGSVENSWQRFLHEKSMVEAQRRNTLIIELAAFGLSNSDIGKKVGLHPNSISRIIARAREDYSSAKLADPRKVRMLLNSGKKKS